MLLFLYPVSVSCQPVTSSFCAVILVICAALPDSLLRQIYAWLCLILHCFALFFIVMLLCNCKVKTIQCNAMHKFFEVLDNLRFVVLKLMVWQLGRLGMAHSCV